MFHLFLLSDIAQIGILGTVLKTVPHTDLVNYYLKYLDNNSNNTLKWDDHHSNSTFLSWSSDTIPNTILISVILLHCQCHTGKSFQYWSQYYCCILNVTGVNHFTWIPTQWSPTEKVEMDLHCLKGFLPSCIECINETFLLEHFDIWFGLIAFKL